MGEVKVQREVAPFLFLIFHFMQTDNSVPTPLEALEGFLFDYGHNLEIKDKNERLGLMKVSFGTKKNFSTLTFIFLLLLGVFPGLVYLAHKSFQGKKDETYILAVDSNYQFNEQKTTYGDLLFQKKFYETLKKDAQIPTEISTQLPSFSQGKMLSYFCRKNFLMLILIGSAFLLFLVLSAQGGV